jgi:titin
VDNKVVEGQEYYYRVKAVNKAGPGDPCDHGRAFKIKAKPAPPTFTQGGIKDLRLKVGETIKYELAISGEPTPTVSWTVDDKPLKAGGRVKISTEKGKTLLKVSINRVMVIICNLDRKCCSWRFWSIHNYS